MRPNWTITAEMQIIGAPATTTVMIWRRTDGSGPKCSM